MANTNQTQSNPFDEAALYDALAGGEARLVREGPLLTGLLTRAPLATVIDTACGTGLHARYLAEAGAQIDAVDLSNGMVGYASVHRSHERITYRVGDMRTPSGGPYGLAVCLGNSLSLLPDWDSLLAAFQGVAGVLIPGGWYLAQILNYAAPSAANPRHRVERKRVEGGHLTVVKNLIPEGRRTFLTIAHLLVTTTGTQMRSDTALLWNWSLAELQEAGASAGLRLRETLGSFDGSPYQAEISSDLIVEFQKPEEGGSA